LSNYFDLLFSCRGGTQLTLTATNVVAGTTPTLVVRVVVRSAGKSSEKTFYVRLLIFSITTSTSAVPARCRFSLVATSCFFVCLQNHEKTTTYICRRDAFSIDRQCSAIMPNGSEIMPSSS